MGVGWSLRGGWGKEVEDVYGFGREDDQKPISKTPSMYVQHAC